MGDSGETRHLTYREFVIGEILCKSGILYPKLRLITILSSDSPIVNLPLKRWKALLHIFCFFHHIIAPVRRGLVSFVEMVICFFKNFHSRRLVQPCQRGCGHDRYAAEGIGALRRLLDLDGCLVGVE
jgi:hypothetical protein